MTDGRRSGIIRGVLVIECYSGETRQERERRDAGGARNNCMAGKSFALFASLGDGVPEIVVLVRRLELRADLT